MHGSDEARLVDDLRRRDGTAYERLVREHGPWMLGLSRRLLADEADAEDALQDAWIHAFRGIDAFEGKARLGTWLHRITVNAALMRLRARQRRRDARPIELEGARAGEGLSPSEVRARGTDPSTDVEAEEARAAVRRAVDALPPAYRVVFVLADIEGLPMSEVAELAQVTLSAAKIRLHRARRALRGRLAPLLDEATRSAS